MARFSIRHSSTGFRADLNVERGERYREGLYTAVTNLYRYEVIARVICHPFRTHPS